jgi:hypothetical protein
VISRAEKFFATENGTIPPRTLLISEPDGQINWPSERGLYFLDTRVVSSWAVYTNGETWELLNGGAITYYAARIFLTNRSLRSLTSFAAGSMPWWAIPCETLQFPARVNKFPVRRNKIPCSDF